jgi:hypothetical protein
VWRTILLGISGHCCSCRLMAQQRYINSRNSIASATAVDCWYQTLLYVDVKV